MKLFNHKKIGPGWGMFLYLYWLKKHHLTHPRKPMYGFEGFDTIILYVQLSASSKVWWQLDQLSIIDLEDFHSHIKHTWCAWDTEFKFDNFIFCHPWYLEYHLWIDSVCYPLLNQFGWREVTPASFFWPPWCYWKPLTAFSQALLVLSLECAAVVAPLQNILKWNITSQMLKNRNVRTDLFRFFFSICWLASDQTHPLQQTRTRQMRRASRGFRPVVEVALEVALVVALVVDSPKPFYSGYHVLFRRKSAQWIV